MNGKQFFFPCEEDAYLSLLGSIFRTLPETLILYLLFTFVHLAAFFNLKEVLPKLLKPELTTVLVKLLAVFDIADLKTPDGNLQRSTLRRIITNNAHKIQKCDSFIPTAF